MPRAYSNKSLAQRGGHKLGSDGEDKVISISLTYAEWCELKVIAAELNLPMKRLIMDAFVKVYGPPKVEHVVKVTGKSPEEAEKLLHPVAHKELSADQAEEKVSSKRISPIAAKLFYRKP